MFITNRRALVLTKKQNIMPHRTVVNKRVIATLKFPTNIPAFIIYVRGIILKLTGNALVPTPYPALVSSLADCTTHINTLELNETTAQTHATGTATTRDIAHEVSKKDMRTIRGMVQALADAAGIGATALIESTGLGVKAAGVKKTRAFSVKNTLVSGAVKMSAPGIKDAKGSHNWFYTTDLVNFTNKQPIPPTTKANTVFPGLPIHIKYAFFHTAITPAGNIEEGPVFLSVI